MNFNKDENVHRFAFSAIRGQRDRERERATINIKFDKKKVDKMCDLR